MYAYTSSQSDTHIYTDTHTYRYTHSRMNEIIYPTRARWSRTSWSCPLYIHLS